MKISLEWLSDFLPGPTDPAVAGDALTHGGLPVETFEQHGADTVIDVEVTSNRGDCLSHVGVARELSALLNREFQDVKHAGLPPVPAGGPPRVSVHIEAPDLCPCYTARVIRNVKIGPSPQWMQRRLEAVGVRPINNVVDVTNYVLFEMGQPLHAFDLDKIQGGQVVVRRAKDREKLFSLDGRERELTGEMLVIADAEKPLALAGVMGGRDSEVTERTVNILLESARFEPLAVRKAARALAMGSDSSYRFERGIDPRLQERASARAAQLILKIAGGEPASGLVEAGTSGYREKFLALRLARLKQVLGIELPVEQVLEALRRDHLQPRLAGDRVECTIPSYRLDLNIEIDLVEEVARIVGYDKVPVRDDISIRLTKPDPAATAMEHIRSTLTAGGYFESVTFSFVSDSLAGDFVPPQAAAGQPLLRAAPNVRKADANLRPSILPGLLESVRHNESAGVADPRLFEIGATFWNDASAIPVECRRVAMVGGAGAAGVAATRSVVEAVLRRLDPTRAVQVMPDAQNGFSRGACGRIEWGGVAIGHLGTIDRSVAQKLSLRELPAAAEMDLQPLLAGVQLVPQLRPLPKFPLIRRDLSLVTPESVRYEMIENLVRDQHLPHLEELQYVTTYRGKPLEKGTKSVTIALVFRSPTETLTSESVDASVAGLVEAARRQGWLQRA